MTIGRPYGSSMLELAGIEYEDVQLRNGMERRRTEMPTTAAVVSIKSETGSGDGPVYIDGIALSEQDYEMDGTWSVSWFSRAQAKRLAKQLGAKLEEV